MIFLLLAIISSAIFYGNNTIDISTYTLTSKKMIKDNVKILQISDLHCKSFGKAQQILLAQIENISPDIIVITGDLIDGRTNPKNYNNSFILVNELADKYPIYYVTGNHEYYADYAEEIKEKLSSLGVIVLDNSSSHTSIKNTSFNIWGIDDNYSYSSESILKDLISNIKESDINILLAHRPEYFNQYSSYDFDFIFLGHAHGGQFRIPFMHKGIAAPGQGIFPELTEGYHTLNNSTMIISRGLGNSIFPFRLFNHPELVVLEISSK
ncbi:metallophosphoesterase [Clostridium paraputrificum]|uniref:metallophosphoesterase n=1 Tax=Clostridium paraputrificum TaxID=29363 RepID=UPI00325B261C